jgi:hypothetical protein
MPGAPVPRPANAALLSGVREIQRPAGVSLERVHDEFWGNIRIDHNMQVARSHMRGEQTPMLVSTDVENRFQDYVALICTQFEGRLLKQGLRKMPKRRLRLPRSGSRHIVVAVRSAFLAREVGSITGKSNQIGGYGSVVIGAIRFSRKISRLPTPGRF